MNKQRFSKVFTKKELRIALGVSDAVLRDWLNNKYFEHISPYGYNINDRILSPKILNILSDILDIYQDDVMKAIGYTK